MISPSSTNEKVTEVGDYIFRVCFIDPFQGFVCAKFAAQSLKLKRAAVFEDLVSDYSKGLSRVFQENFKAMGGEIVAVESYQGAQTDFRAQLNAMKAKNPDFLFVPGYYSEVPSIAKQAREVGLKVPMIGGDGWEAEELLVNAGTALEGCYYSNHFHLDDPDETLQAFRRAYKEKYGKDPDSMAALGYDAAMVLVEAIKRCGSTEGPKLRDAIAATKEHRGATGSITLNSKRNAEKPAVIVKIVGKEKRFAEKVAP
jgi:branched-chain amino acid transport system substrate-binding protein